MVPSDTNEIITVYNLRPKSRIQFCEPTMKILERFETTQILSTSHRVKSGRAQGCDGWAGGIEETHPEYDNSLH